MVSKYTITFHEVGVPISQPVTKFGGQPVWHTAPAWPLSQSTGHPMRFLAQIVLDPVLFGAVYGRMAYLFMTDEDEFVDRTWEPDSGENAVVIQPGQPSSSTTQPLLTGPTLIKMVHRPDQRHLTAVACEFSVELMLGEDPEPALVHDPDVLSGNKIGGTPGWLQGPEFPAGDEAWRLLLHLDSTRVPFSVNFGAAGIAYAFIASDGTSGKLLWQSA